MNDYLSIAAITLYCLATIFQLRRLKSGNVGVVASVLGLLAVSLHALAAITAIHTAAGIDLGLAQMLSLITWLICLITLSASIRRPIHNLLVVLYPLAAISLLTELLLPVSHEMMSHVSPGVFSHIIFSILSYSVLTVAALQAIALAMQDRMLKQHKLKGLPSILPPLQTMEAMLFELIWVGFILLTLAIGSGALYVDDLLGQHLAHKTVFTLIAWLLFGILLWGRATLGWRSQTAIRWTLWAFASLLVAYIGTKVVLEWVLN